MYFKLLPYFNCDIVNYMFRLPYKCNIKNDDALGKMFVSELVHAIFLFNIFKFYFKFKILLKSSFYTLFQHPLLACCCISEVITLVGSNLKCNRMQYVSMCMLKQQFTTESSSF